MGRLRQFSVEPQQTSVLKWRFLRQPVDICRNLEFVGDNLAGDNNLGYQETFSSMRLDIAAMRLIEKNQRNQCR